MAHRKGFASAIAGIVLLIGAGILGFTAGYWVPAIILGGAGSSAFIAGIQYDNQSGL